jgi:hypothetical protein
MKSLRIVTMKKLAVRVAMGFTVLPSLWMAAFVFVIIALKQFDKQLFLMKPR